MKLPFDKIYCLHLTESEERLNSSKQEFIKMGIYDDVNYWWTCRHPYTKEIHDFLVSNGFFRINIMNAPNAYNCARNWYEIIKTSYLRGYEHILCFEDDIIFNVSKEEFETFMNNIPNDYDIIRFAYIDHNNTFKDNECLYVEDYNNFFYGAMMFALNRNGMKYYIDYMDEHFGAADFPFGCIDYIGLKGIKNYFASKNFYDIKNDYLLKSVINNIQ